MSNSSDAFWIGKNKTIAGLLAKGHGKKAFEAQHKILDASWSQAFNLLSPGGYLIVFAQRSSRKVSDRHSFFDNASRITYACQKLGFNALPSIKWRKASKTPPHYMGSGMLPAGAYVVSQYDDILIFRKGAQRTFDEVEQVRRSESALFCEERNAWYLDLWSDVTYNLVDKYIKDFTTTTIPSELYIRLMAMYSIQGDHVLDLYGDNLLTTLAGGVLGRNTLSLCEESAEDSLKVFSKRKLKSILNDRCASRITDHMAYAKTKDGLLLRFKNQPLGVPVQTTQEKKIQNYVIQSIKSNGSEVSFKYRKWKKAELSEMITS